MSINKPVGNFSLFLVPIGNVQNTGFRNSIFLVDFHIAMESHVGGSLRQFGSQRAPNASAPRRVQFGSPPCYMSPLPAVLISVAVSEFSNCASLFVINAPI